jgi:hypothetical protein
MDFMGNDDLGNDYLRTLSSKSGDGKPSFDPFWKMHMAWKRGIVSFRELYA